MSLYKGQADQTVIKAAKAAYTMPDPVDYTKFIEGLGEVAEFVIGKIGAVNDRMSTISGFEDEVDTRLWNNNNKGFFDEHKNNMVEASNIMKFNPKWSQKYKDAEKIWNDGQGVLEKIKTDQDVLESWIKSAQRGLVDLSTFNSPALLSLMADIKLGKNFDNSVEFTKDGIMVIGENGDPRNKIFVNELPQIVKKTDGKETNNFIENTITSSINSKIKGNWTDRSKYTIMKNIESQIDAVGINNMGSAAFDYTYVTELGEMSFADYLLETDPTMQKAYNKYLDDNPGKHGKDALKGIKHMVAQNLWDNDLLMKDEFMKFIEGSLDFQLSQYNVDPKYRKNTNRTNVGTWKNLSPTSVISGMKGDTLNFYGNELAEGKFGGYTRNNEDGSWKHDTDGTIISGDQMLRLVNEDIKSNYPDASFNALTSGMFDKFRGEVGESKPFELSYEIGEEINNIWNDKGYASDAAENINKILKEYDIEDKVTSIKWGNKLQFGEGENEKTYKIGKGDAEDLIEHIINLVSKDAKIFNPASDWKK